MSVELQVLPNGTIRSIYKDENQTLFDKLGKLRVERASNVEWEDDGTEHGWTVRAAHDPELAIRAVHTGGCFTRVVAREGELLYFNTRESALDTEVEHFWDLLPTNPKQENS